MEPNATTHGTLFFVRLVLYTIFVLGVAFVAWKLYPEISKRQLVNATIYMSAPLALDSTTIAVNSAILALEEVGYKAGDIIVSLTVVEGGDETGAWSEENERSNAENAVRDESVVAYLGPLNSGAAKISMPILNRAGIAQISSANTWPGLTKSGFIPGEPGIFYPVGTRHYFRVATTDDLQGPAGAAWASSLGYQNVFVVNDSDAYGVGIANLFEAEARRRGMTVLGHESITADPTTHRTVVDRVVSSGADLVYYGGITPNGGPEFLRLLREASSTAVFMGTDGIYEQDFITRAGEGAAEGVLVTSVGVPPVAVDTPSAKEFVARYRERFKAEPDVFGALTYDAMKALIQSVERAGVVDRALVLAEMRKGQVHDGVFGSWKFNEQGDTTQHLLSGNTITGGVFEFSKILSSE